MFECFAPFVLRSCVWFTQHSLHTFFLGIIGDDQYWIFVCIFFAKSCMELCLSLSLKCFFFSYAFYWSPIALNVSFTLFFNCCGFYNEWMPCDLFSAKKKKKFSSRVLPLNLLTEMPLMCLLWTKNFCKISTIFP